MNEDSDITHSSGPRGPRIVERAVPRMLDQLPVIPPRDLDHEVAPTMPPPIKTGGQMIAEQTIGHIDQATNVVIDMIEKLIEELVRTKEVVMTSKIQAQDVIRSHMVISETAMKSTQQIAQQVVEWTNALATRTNGK